MVLDPLQFFRDFVEPTVADWRCDPISIRRAIQALTEFDNLAEHFVIAKLQSDPTRQEVALQREELGTESVAVAIARDLHDSHKHGRLSRRSALIRQGQRPREIWEGGAFDHRMFDNQAFDVGQPVLIIEADDGTRHYVGDIIDSALRFWHSKLQCNVEP